MYRDRDRRSPPHRRPPTFNYVQCEECENRFENPSTYFTHMQLTGHKKPIIVKIPMRVVYPNSPDEVTSSV